MFLSDVLNMLSSHFSRAIILLKYPKKRKQQANFLFEQSKYKMLAGAGAHACNPSYSGGRDQEDCLRFEASPGK
jgi:regulator of replication initiation timing